MADALVLWELTVSRMRARYRRTFAGFLWVVANPILIYGVQAFIFKHVLRIQVANYSAFLIGGLLPWTFIVSSLETGIPIFQVSRDLLTGMRVQPMVLVGAALLDSWINFVFALILVVVPSIFFYSFNPRGLFLLPIAIVPLLVGMAGVLAFLALLNVFYRDTRFLSGFAIHVLFYLTPLFYPIEFLPEGLRGIAKANPLFVLIEPVRGAIYQFSMGGFWILLARASFVALAICGFSIYYWKRKRNEFYHFL